MTKRITVLLQSGKVGRRNVEKKEKKQAFGENLVDVTSNVILTSRCYLQFRNEAEVGIYTDGQILLGLELRSNTNIHVLFT